MFKIYIPERLTFLNVEAIKAIEDYLKDQQRIVEDVSLDFALTNFVDSIGLGKVLKLYSSLRKKEKQLYIVNVQSEFLRRKFSYIQLHKIIPWK